MVLFLTAINRKAEFRDFFCLLGSLEHAFDALSAIAATGDRIIEARLLDEGKWTTLPIDIFDGQSFSTAIRVLETEWQQVLAQPLHAKPVHDPYLIDLTYRQIERHKTRIAHLRMVIKGIEQQRQKIITTVLKPHQSRLIDRLDNSISQYQRHLERTQEMQRYTTERLTRWQGSKMANSLNRG